MRYALHSKFDHKALRQLRLAKIETDCRGNRENNSHTD